MTKRKGTIVQGGRTYGRVTPAGPLVPAPDTLTPDCWICRRLADFPPGTLPTVALVAPCAKCRAAVVYDSTRELAAPRICMQCAGIQPLPVEATP